MKIKQHSSNQTKKGFTIIEFVLSMAFVGVLLVTIAIITVNIITVYQKGLSIRAVNSTGRELIEEFSNSIASAPAKSIAGLCSRFNGTPGYQKCINDNGQKMIFQEIRYNGTISLQQDASMNNIDLTVENPPLYGAFCTGRYSYIWNTGYTLNPSYNLNGYVATVAFRSLDNYNVNYLQPKLVRDEDQERSVCSSKIDNNYELTSDRTYNLGDRATYASVAQLLNNAEDNLAIYDFQVFPPTQHHITFHSFYSGTFILATLQGSVNITAAGDYCTEIPENLNTDFAYCAINKFNFAMRATGELNENEKRQNQ